MTITESPDIAVLSGAGDCILWTVDTDNWEAVLSSPGGLLLCSLGCLGGGADFFVGWNFLKEELTNTESPVRASC